MSRPVLMKLSVIAAVVFLTGCMHSLHQVHVSDYEPYGKGGSRIMAESEQFVVMGFTDNTDYVDEAYGKLKKKCPRGEIVGITTEHITSLSFFSWENRIRMKGRCVKG